MEEEELQLPTLPISVSEPRLPTLRPPFIPVPTSKSRKRSTRSDELVNETDLLSTSLHTSSDPALFSSDETPDAENYAGGKRRKKKHYAGTWWGEKIASSALSRSGSASGSDTSSHRGLSRMPLSIDKKKKRQFTRNFDSGVFMNSDDSQASSEFDISSDSSLGNELLESIQRDKERTVLASPAKRSFLSNNSVTPVKSLVSGSHGTQSPALSSPGRVRMVRNPIQIDDVQQRALAIIRDCLDDGKEDVDLSSMKLEKLPDEVRGLAAMVSNDKADQMQYDSLVARPRLYLANNILRVLPSPVLELTNLRLLSLRQNKLKKLPAGIRNLVKLEELNIAGNKLQFLPIEVLDLMANHRLKKLHSEPNPWLERPETQDQPWPIPSRLPNRAQWQVGQATEKATGEIVTLKLTATTEKFVELSKPRMTTLSELVLRQLSRTNSTKEDLSALMPQFAPNSVTEMLQDLHSAQNEGGRRCVGCKRAYVQPAEKWIEWWYILGGPRVPLTTGGMDRSSVLPFEVGICGNCC